MYAVLVGLSFLVSRSGWPRWARQGETGWQRDVVTVDTRALSQLPDVMKLLHDCPGFICSSRGGSPPTEDALR